jgi:hypothetical protein
MLNGITNVSMLEKTKQNYKNKSPTRFCNFQEREYDDEFYDSLVNYPKEEM